jgi:hypothetical protein
MTLLSTFGPVLCAIIVAAGETQAPALETLQQAIARAASQRTLKTEPPAAHSNWAHVIALATGTEMTITEGTGPPVRRVMVTADASRLTTLDLTYPGLTPKARRALLVMATRIPREINALTGTLDFKERPVRLAVDGVFVDGQKMADLGEIVDTVDRQEVREISLAHRRGSILGAAVGAGGGFALGFVLAARLADTACKPSCASEEGLMTASLVGLPVGLGLLGYHAVRIHDVPTIVYRRPPS